MIFKPGGGPPLLVQKELKKDTKCERVDPKNLVAKLCAIASKFMALDLVPR